VFGALLVAGCGGSSHSATHRVSPTTPPVQTATIPATTATTKSTTTPTISTQTKATPSGGAGLPSSGPPKPSSNGGGTTNARIPATYQISASGQVSPPVITAPAFLAIQLTVVAGDGRAHTVTLKTPTPHTFHVAAGARGQILIPGLRAGRYPLAIDGADKAALVTGGEPGP
jgi:hypothetical protein